MTTKGLEIFKSAANELRGTPWFEVAFEINSENEMEKKYPEIYKEINSYEKQCAALAVERMMNKKFDFDLKASAKRVNEAMTRPGFKNLFTKHE